MIFVTNMNKEQVATSYPHAANCAAYLYELVPCVDIECVTRLYRSERHDHQTRRIAESECNCHVAEIARQAEEIEHFHNQLKDSFHHPNNWQNEVIELRRTLSAERQLSGKLEKELIYLKSLIGAKID